MSDGPAGALAAAGRFTDISTAIRAAEDARTFDAFAKPHGDITLVVATF